MMVVEVGFWQARKRARMIFLIVTGVKIPHVGSSKQWEEHFKNFQRKIIAFYYKSTPEKPKEFRKTGSFGCFYTGRI